MNNLKSTKIAPFLVCLVTIFTVSPAFADIFAIGQSVKVTANLNVRKSAGLAGEILSTQFRGTPGKVLGGPVTKDGFTWWNIDYVAGADGWSVENFLADAAVPFFVSTKFFVGNRITTTTPVPVNSFQTAAGTLLGTQPVGAVGTVVSKAIKTPDNTIWWNVDYDNGIDGWSKETDLLKIQATGFTPAEVTSLVKLHDAYMKFAMALSNHLVPILNQKTDATNAAKIGQAMNDFIAMQAETNGAISLLLGANWNSVAPVKQDLTARAYYVDEAVNHLLGRISGGRYRPQDFLAQAKTFKTGDAEYQNHLDQAITLINEAQAMMKEFDKTLPYANFYPYPPTPNGSHTLVGPHGDYDPVVWNLQRSYVYFIRTLEQLASIIGTPGMDYTNYGKSFDALAAVNRNSIHAQFVVSGVIEENPDPFFAIFDAVRPLTVETPQRLNDFSFAWQAQLLPLLSKHISPSVDFALIDAMGIAMDAWDKADHAVWNILVFPDCDAFSNPLGCGGRGDSATPLTPEPSPGFTAAEKSSMMQLYQAWLSLNRNLTDASFHFATNYNPNLNNSNHELVGAAFEQNVAAVQELGQALGRLMGAKDTTSFIRPSASERSQMVAKAIDYHLPKAVTAINLAIGHLNQLKGLSNDATYQDHVTRMASGLFTASDQIAAFDKTLAYKDPYPFPVTPNGSRTLVGPHGDYDHFVWNAWRSTMLYTRVMDDVAKAWKIGSPNGNYDEFGRVYFLLAPFNINAMTSQFGMTDILVTEKNRFFSALEAFKPLISETPEGLHFLQFEWQKNYMPKLGSNSAWDALIKDAISVTLDGWTQTDLTVWSGLLMPDCTILKNASGCKLEKAALTYNKLPIPSQELSAGSQVLYHFSVSAGETDTSLEEPVFALTVVATTVQDLVLSAYDDANFSKSAFLINPIADKIGNITSGSAVLPLHRTFVVPAGTTKYFELRAKVSKPATGGSVTISYGNLPAEILKLPGNPPQPPVPPIISNVSISGLTSSAATISWKTDKLSTSQVEYGLTPSYTSSTPINSTLVTSHSLALSALSPNTPYNFRVKSKDADNLETASINFTFKTLATVNVGPVVNAGADKTISLASSANLVGTATDDGLPNGTLNISWSKVSGPGSVTFGNPTLLFTSANISMEGVYVLRLSVGDGSLTTTDDITVTVLPKPVTQGSDTTAPSISLTVDVTGIGWNWRVYADAVASDNIGVKQVDFYVNGSLRARDSTSPYQAGWKPQKSVDTYSLQAWAYDAAGNIGKSNIVTLKRP